MKDKIIQIMNETMGLDVTTLDQSELLENISEWDSFNGLMLVSKYQDEFDVEFSANEVDGVKTIGDIISLVKKKAEKN